MEKATRLSQIEFDRQAPDYDDSGFSAQARKLHPAVLAALAETPTAPLLEVGCGTGLFLAAWLVARGPDAVLAGVDLSEQMAALARKRLPPTAVIKQGDAAVLDFPDQAFGIVACVASFHHYPRPREVLVEMNRVLLPDGCLVIADLHFPWPIRMIANLLLPLGTSGDHRIHSRGMLVRLLNQTGFTLSHWEIIPGGNSLAIARKRSFT